MDRAVGAGATTRRVLTHWYSTVQVLFKLFDIVKSGTVHIVGNSQKHPSINSDAYRKLHRDGSIRGTGVAKLDTSTSVTVEPLPVTYSKDEIRALHSNQNCFSLRLFKISVEDEGLDTIREPV